MSYQDAADVMHIGEEGPGPCLWCGEDWTNAAQGEMVPPGAVSGQRSGVEPWECHDSDACGPQSKPAVSGKPCAGQLARKSGPPLDRASMSVEDPAGPIPRLDPPWAALAAEYEATVAALEEELAVQTQHGAELADLLLQVADWLEAAQGGDSRAGQERSLALLAARSALRSLHAERAELRSQLLAAARGARQGALYRCRAAACASELRRAWAEVRTLRRRLAEAELGQGGGDLGAPP
ncbi:hypothetical protein ACKKBG_A29740 [Auxenochlorella protothecoides x Auxenochlorella symbiontica]